MFIDRDRVQRDLDRYDAEPDAPREQFEDSWGPMTWVGLAIFVIILIASVVGRLLTP